MAFDLNKALGYDKVLSNLDNMDVEPIGLQRLKENEKNFFAVDALQDLKDSIEMHGILQPLLVVPAGDNYRIVAGHRRYAAAKALLEEGNEQLKEVPCIVLPEMSEAMEWAMLIQTNTSARELTHYEKAEAAIRLKKQLVELKKAGMKIPGSLRAIVAEQMALNDSEIARMEKTDKDLHEGFRPLWKSGSIDASCAYALSQLPKEDQSELLDKMNRNGCRMNRQIVEDYSLQKECADWACKDCPYPATAEEKEKRGEGWKFPCHHLKTLRTQRWATDGKCTCCDDCEKAARCLSACSGAKVAALEKARQKKAREEASKEEALRTNAEKAFENSPLAGVRDRFSDAMSRIGFNCDDVSEGCTDYFDENLSYSDDFSIPYGVIKDMAEAKVAEDVPVDFALVLAICETLFISPNDLFGYSCASLVSWHSFPDEKPADGQRVVIRRTVGTIVRCGEYVYRGGEWYEPGLDDFKMNITGVTHWIECPGVWM